MRNHVLDHRIPPPVVALVLAGLMWLLGGQQWHWHAPVGVFLALGLAIDASGLWAFWRHRTTINPLSPHRASALVDSGIYRFTRNPMYVGLVCLLVAWTLALGSWLALLGPLVFVAYITLFQIVPEERALLAHFGPDFEAYCQRVRRWL